MQSQLLVYEVMGVLNYSYNKKGPDTFWLKDASLEDTENLPAPGVIAVEIVEDLEADLEKMKLIAEDLSEPI